MKISDLYNKTWKKCVIVFLIIFLIVAVGGFISINYLNEMMMDNHVHSDTIIVKDKFIGKDMYDDCFIITDMNNQTYLISNNNKDYDKRLFDNITIGQKYRVTVKESMNNNNDINTYIIQVHDDNS